MKIGILTNLTGDFITFARKYAEILEYNKIPFELLNIHDDALLEKLSNLDFLIHVFSQNHTEKKWGKNIIYLAENLMGLSCFPNYSEIWHYDEKLIQTLLFESKGIPIVPTKLFFDKKNADSWLKTASYPLVFKLSSGAGSGAVALVKSYKNAIKITNRIFTKGIPQSGVPGSNTNQSILKRIQKKIHIWLATNYRKFHGREINLIHENQVGYAIFQDFLPNNDFDTRVNIIGERAFAFRRWNRENDFRASGSGKIDYNKNEVNKECIKLAFKVSELFGFRNMAFDFLFDSSGKPMLVEITYIYKDYAVFDCPGYWDKQFNWHSGNYWPQYFHLYDLLNYTDLKMPVTN